MKRYLVYLETFDTDEVIVEAENEDAAQETALELMGYDWDVTSVEELDD